MNEQSELMLVGAEALKPKDRLEARGYIALEWGSGVRAVSAGGQQPQLGELRQWLGALPILLGVSEPSIASRELCFSSGADDFWLSTSALSDLLQRVRLHLFPQKR